MNAAAPVMDKVLIEFAGREYTVKLEMAEIFLRHALSAFHSGAEELIPLHHRDGIEMLLVTPSSPLRIGSCE